MHLREIEECNSIPLGSIAKARWIKPVYRRTPGQRAVHAIFVIKDIDTTNICIRDSIKICGLHLHPCRLKHEPMQCMRCRKWGHFANACTAPADTCEAWGEEHCTNECANKDKTFCVSCRSDTHTSWDCNCPVFRRRCGQFNENYPENNLTYFPTEENLTLTPRLQRLQHTDKFPASYAVAPLQQSERMTWEPPVRNQGKQRKQHVC